MKLKLTLRESVLLFFCRNPEESLNTFDIMTKWGISDRVTVGRLLRGAVEQALLDRQWSPNTGPAVYSAGPALLAEVGR